MAFLRGEPFRPTASPATSAISLSIVDELSSNIARLEETIAALSSEELEKVNEALTLSLKAVIEQKQHKEWEKGDDLIRLD